LLVEGNETGEKLKEKRSKEKGKKKVTSNKDAREWAQIALREKKETHDLDLNMKGGGVEVGCLETTNRTVWESHSERKKNR